MDKNRPSIIELQAFGYLIAGILLIIAFWPLVKSIFGYFIKKIIFKRWWALIPALVLLYLARTSPQSLENFYFIWMKVGKHLAWINTNLILGVVFFFIITPIGFIMRLFGYDPLLLAVNVDEPTFRTKAQNRPSNHMERQF